ncbi:MAG: hypothetical protein ACTSVR_03210 [Candidatus Thorarchaeota archaeon]
MDLYHWCKEAAGVILGVALAAGAFMLFIYLVNKLWDFIGWLKYMFRK